MSLSFRKLFSLWWNGFDSVNVFINVRTISLAVDEWKRKFLISLLIVNEHKSNEHERQNYSSQFHWRRDIGSSQQNELELIISRPFRLRVFASFLWWFLTLYEFELNENSSLTFSSALGSFNPSIIHSIWSSSFGYDVN